MIILIKISLFFVSGLLLSEMFLKKESTIIKGLCAIAFAVFIIPNFALAIGFIFHKTISITIICSIAVILAIIIYLLEIYNKK